MNDNESKKKKFRQTKLWKSFRNVITHKFGHKDPITDKPLRKGYSVHHMDLNPDNYDKLLEDNFVPLNALSHKFIHWLYPYYIKDKNIIMRIVEILEKMERLNK